MTKKNWDNDQVLTSWHSLNDVISKFTESQLEQLLEVEQANKRRSNMLKRIHQRMAKLRNRRERKAIGIRR